jgi:hypothetical protein
MGHTLTVSRRNAGSATSAHTNRIRYHRMYRAGFPRHTSRRTSRSALAGVAGRARETITSFQSGEALASDAKTLPGSLCTACASARTRRATSAAIVSGQDSGRCRPVADTCSECRPAATDIPMQQRCQAPGGEVTFCASTGFLALPASFAQPFVNAIRMKLHSHGP